MFGPFLVVYELDIVGQHFEENCIEHHPTMFATEQDGQMHKYFIEHRCLSVKCLGDEDLNNLQA